ncbi:hypothetical protein RYZ26_19475 [Terasakiella sp. A23]|uniref:hypothetical protein n=1 Tax=Terasakiella sp. FCG-A23 TaxID=3080561 RepID=UPI002954FA4F|nr:hypothetical protein [Terasakiella sp. A23]MDV7341790.1 hypothetical protein [Terasakiella sp. A23]
MIGLTLSEQVSQAISDGEDTGEVMKGFMSNNKAEPKGATIRVGENSILWETAGIESKVTEQKITPFVMPGASAFFLEHEKQLYIQMHTKQNHPCNFRLNKVS